MLESTYPCVSWMSDMYVRQLRIWDVVLPGTHNSATWQGLVNEDQSWNLESIVFIKLYVMCQKCTIYEQLMEGVRFLDLRVCKSPNKGSEPYCAHNGFLTVSFKAVLKDIALFCQSNSTEVVVLSVRRDVAHLYDAQSLSVVESDFFVALILRRFLGAALTANVTVGELADRGQNVLYFFEEKERCLPFSSYRKGLRSQDHVGRAATKCHKKLSKKKHSLILKRDCYDASKSYYHDIPKLPLTLCQDSSWNQLNDTSDKILGSSLQRPCARKVLAKLVSPAPCLCATNLSEYKELDDISSSKENVALKSRHCTRSVATFRERMLGNSSASLSETKESEPTTSRNKLSRGADHTMKDSYVAKPLLSWLKRNSPHFYFGRNESLTSFMHDDKELNVTTQVDALTPNTGDQLVIKSTMQSHELQCDTPKDTRSALAPSIEDVTSNVFQNDNPLSHKFSLNAACQSPHSKKKKTKKKKSQNLSTVPKKPECRNVSRLQSVPIFMTNTKKEFETCGGRLKSQHLKKCSSLAFITIHPKSWNRASTVQSKQYELPMKLKANHDEVIYQRLKTISHDTGIYDLLKSGYSSNNKKKKNPSI